METENLIIDYPDIVDPADARKHADALQSAYDVYRAMFAFGKGELYGGAKATIEFKTSTAVSMAGHNHLYMGSEILDQIREGYFYPPNQTFFHEMGHLFETAEDDAGRYYVYRLVGGMDEGLVDYLKCHPEIFKIWERDVRSKATCDLILHAVGAKGPEWTLAYFESHTPDPYIVNWNEHPSGVSGEILFPQMMARVSDLAGWNVWDKFFGLTKDSGGEPSAKDAFLAWSESKPVDRVNDPMVKKAFAEFVVSLGQAAGQDLLPLFRGWGFEL